MSFEKDHFNYLQRLYYKLVRNHISDKAYANMCLRRWLGKGDVSNPETFNEKLQWLKIYDRNINYVKMADKLAVRTIIKDTIGDKYLNTLLCIWQKPNEIDWEQLPSQFVLKTTHASGTNIIVKNKSILNKEQANRQLEKWLSLDYSMLGREWVYKNIPRKIIAEKYLTDDNCNIPKDYKIFCFNGQPYFIQVDIDRFGAHRRAYFDTSWERQPFTILYEPYNGKLNRPKYLDEMLWAATKLSKNIPFVRVDFYALPEIIFGEMTFYPGAATEPFVPDEWDLQLGKLLELP